MNKAQPYWVARFHLVFVRCVFGLLNVAVLCVAYERVSTCDQARLTVSVVNGHPACTSLYCWLCLVLFVRLYLLPCLATVLCSERM